MGLTGTRTSTKASAGTAARMEKRYLARDSTLGRTVALKMLRAEVASDEERMHRFVQEAKAAAGLNHPNIAHIYDIGEINGAKFWLPSTITVKKGDTLKIHAVSKLKDARGAAARRCWRWRPQACPFASYRA